ncbi:MAG: PAS domain-containing protein [Acidobacteriota bacterium]
MPGFSPSYPWIENIPLAALVLDDTWCPREWNEAFERLLASLSPARDVVDGCTFVAEQLVSRMTAGSFPSEIVIRLGEPAAAVRLRAWKSSIANRPLKAGAWLVLLARVAGPRAEAAAGGAELLRALMDHTTDNIYFKDRNSRFLRINSSQASWLGLAAPEDAVGKTDFDFFSAEHAQQAFEDEQEVMRTGKAIVGKEEKETWPDGSTTWVSTTKVPLRGPDGAIIGTLGISRDITEHKRVEEELNRTNELLETIFSSIHVKIAYMDSQFNFIRVNKAYADADEQEPAFFVGKNHFDLYPHPQNKEIFREVVRTCRPYFAINRPFVYPKHPERGTTFSDWSLEPVLDPQGSLKGLVLSLINVTERTRAEQELQVSREDFRRLSARLESAIEEERRRIAHELHDELGQSLTALKMELARIAEDQRQVPSLFGGLHSVLEMIGSCVEAVRRISQELRPAILDHLGLGAAVEWHAGEFQKRTGIICELQSDLDVSDLHGEVSMALFRIIQEALTNVARHSGASRAIVCLGRSPAGLSIAIRDNGRGLDLTALHSSSSLGILGMRERAARLGGSFSIRSRPEVDGTEIRVVIPDGGE